MTLLPLERWCGRPDAPFPLPVLDSVLVSEVAAYRFEFPEDRLAMPAHLFQCALSGRLGFRPNGERPEGALYLGDRLRLARALYGLVDLAALVESGELRGNLVALSGLVSACEQFAAEDLAGGATARTLLRTGA